MAKKDYGSDKFATQKSFNNYQDGSQDFTKVVITSRRIEASFNNKGSGFQNLKGLKIQCDDKSIWDSFQEVALFGMDKLFNYDQNGSQTFLGFTFLKYLQTSSANRMGGMDPNPNPETKTKKTKTKKSKT
ncbi:hypothetical protein PHAVU_002G195200 [Phaseolus vulgaris]|uniref:Uncharacterized protein n=1 Tax=Phaseolus vulgaris TaxID=3885 RepID=V7CPS4_PHAVU|nr:hypothetical protein PHAVU_002G195200g [Phaseolus vulgaris]ESW30941.1 hypothetical protein PHAVU_002G195200g [Phaseolus vulgaris]